MSWNPITRPVNKFLLQNVWSPGVCVGPEGAAIERALDERRGYGIDFAFVVYTGRKLAHFRTNLILWDKATWDEYNAFQPLLHATPRRGAVNTARGTGYDPATAFSIWHPQLALLEIYACMVEKEHQPQIGPKGSTIIPVDFCQVKTAPRPAYAKPEATKDTPLDPMDQRINDLTSQLTNPSQMSKLAPVEPNQSVLR